MTLTTLWSSFNAIFSFFFLLCVYRLLLTVHIFFCFGLIKNPNGPIRSCSITLFHCSLFLFSFSFFFGFLYIPATILILFVLAVIYTYIHIYIILLNKTPFIEAAQPGWGILPFTVSLCKFFFLFSTFSIFYVQSPTTTLSYFG